MDVDKNTKEKIMQLQLSEQKLQNFLMQKQQFQGQLMEIDNALGELDSGKGEVFRIIGNIMISSNRDDLKKDLKEKKHILELRIKNIEKQEEKIKEEADEIQKEVVSKLEKIKND